MTTPHVSVILPVFDRENTIVRAVASVLGQTFGDFELIIVDDCSQDGTGAAIAGLSDKRIRSARHSKNRGAAAARNTGIKEARGRYIAFLDSDDEWLPNKLLVETTMMNSAKPGEPGSCARHFVAVGLDGGSWRRLLPQDIDWRRRLLTVGCDLSPGSTLIVRRDIFEELGLFDETLRRYEDWDWLLRYLSLYNMRIMEETLAVIHLSSPPASGALRDSARIFLARWQEESRLISWSGPRRLRARTSIDRAKSQIYEKRYFPSFLTVAWAVFNWPFQRPGSIIAMIRYLRGRYPKR